MKNAFSFTLKALFALKIFKVLSWLFGHVEKRLINSKIYDVTTWETNSWDTYIAWYLKSNKDNPTLKFCL